ncbi:TAXI family TRAP transporter solute-binding subunit [Methylobacterium sp. WL120]|uniref:TAXI family TRAP transporter solute-binding subunit n=1 Tax=Methylobacterium sp. WL120 TaxID=2603887 RepID=UPI0011C8D59C|nr:TAXI family TRAP transporter solute-binding subunit [Methylobacterium sp. WL120]TXM65753.1 TRAP transporter substrate-binding protein [Methylobacterium sp. WL120]
MRALLAGLLLGSSLFAAPAAADPGFRLCTGYDTGNYFKAGHLLKRTSTSVPVEVVASQGSLDNLAKMIAGQCDGAFVQADAMLVFSSRNAQALSGIERAGVLYAEDAHLLCNRTSGIGRVTDLTKVNTVAVGPDGTGARTTWDAFVLADKKRYGPVQTDPRSGVRALSAVSDGSQVQCLLYVGAPGASFMKDDASALGDRVVLAGTDDWDMGGVAKDSRGKAVYGYGEIPAGTYPRIQPGGVVFGTKPVKTITVEALFVTSTAWISGNEGAYDKVLRAFTAAGPAIKALAKPGN